MTPIEDDIERIGILNVDPGLEPFRDHFKYRMKRYVDQKTLFEKHEGGLEEFAKGDVHSWWLYLYLVKFLFLLRQKQ